MKKRLRIILFGVVLGALLLSVLVGFTMRTHTAHADYNPNMCDVDFACGQGYDQGYMDGQSDPIHCNTSPNDNTGQSHEYRDGYTRGFSDGLQDCQSHMPPAQ